MSRAGTLAPDHDAGGPRLAVTLHESLPGRFEVGFGQYLVVSGDCLAADQAIGTLALCAGDRCQDAELSRIPGGVSFWQALYINRDCIGSTLQIGARVRLANGRVVEQALGELSCRDVDWQPAPVPSTDGEDLVAICMATYEPSPDAFERQVASIRDQSHRNWLCIIQDDGSSDEAWARVRANCADDPRFSLQRNRRNLGFYHNFEAALKRVPENAAYVAFADQDDRWYTDKLARLLEALGAENAALAYSDMRIVDAEGGEVAGSYWSNRKNEYRDLAVVLVANTVTGAASVFRRDLLAQLVPFPPRVGDAFHDHWLACLALSRARVAYVAAPLYEYYQYGSSVIGHCDFVRFTLAQRIASVLRAGARLCRPRVARPWLRGKYGAALAVYRGECRRLRLVQDTIRQRGPVAPGRRAALRLFDGGLRSVARLLAVHVRVLFRGQTTDDAELRLAMGELARFVEARRR